MLHSSLYTSRRLNVNCSYQCLLLPYRQHTCTWTNTELHLTDMKNHLRNKLFKGTNIFRNLLYPKISLPWIQLPFESLGQPYSLHQLPIAPTNLGVGQELLWGRDIAATPLPLPLSAFSMGRRHAAGRKELTLQHWGLGPQHGMLASSEGEGGLA